jgi:outer membrane protein TolC
LRLLKTLKHTMSDCTPRKRLSGGTLAGKALLIPLLVLAGARQVNAQEPPLAEPARALFAETVPVQMLRLADCLHLALEGHPKVAAARANLASAEDARRALEMMKLPALVSQEIPVRRRQAALGVSAAAAALAQTEQDVAYAVTRSYFTVLYAREQAGVAKTVVERLTAVHSLAQKQLDAGAKEVTSADVQRTLVYLRLAGARRQQALQGEKRALAALKEAVGRGPGFCFDVPSGRMPELEARLCKDDIIAAALARRGEVVRAQVFAEVTGLEVHAQGSRAFPHRVETFAAGADIHGNQVAPTLRNDEYRPGGTVPEMPTLLVGSREERMQRASSLSARAAAGVEDTRNLIALEAENAVLRFEEATAELALAREAATAGDKLADDLTMDLTSRQKVKVEEVVNAQVLASQARAQANEYLYRQILALAELERVTGGAFCARLAEWDAAPAASPAK